MEEDCVQWEQECACAESTKRNPDGPGEHVREEVEPWKEQLAEQSYNQPWMDVKDG